MLLFFSFTFKSLNTFGQNDIQEFDTLTDDCKRMENREKEQKKSSAQITTNNKHEHGKQTKRHQLVQ